MFDLNNQISLVVGGARGIGAAIVETLALNGMKVWIFDTDLVSDPYNHYQARNIGGYKAAMELTDKLSKKNLNVSALNIDASSDDSVIEGIKHIITHDGCPRFLVNAIGSTQSTFTINTTTSQFNSILNTNLTAPYIVCRELAKELIKNKISGSFINIGSIAGKNPFASISAYSAAKAGLSAFTTSLAVELAEHKIQANTICPGMVKTNMWKYLRNQLNEENESDDEFWDRMSDMIPQKSFQDEFDIADIVVSVLKNTSITGQSFSIDGGMNRHA